MTGLNTIPFTIIKEEEFLDYKVSYDILVDVVDGRLPTKEELAAISVVLRSGKMKHKKVFVCFYLPGMQVNAGAFATAHHDPNLQPVTINWFFVPDKYQSLLRKE